MAGRTLDLDVLVGKDALATQIANKFQEWESFRSSWANQKKELRNYLFATDTSTTSNSALPWKNSTTVPKITQIRDNLHANYMAALFPQADWLTWEGNDEGDEIEAKRSAIESYMRTKLRQDRAEVTISQLLLDFIDYGNCFATAEWVDESTMDENGDIIRGYVGPRIIRVSPYDVVFNPAAPNFVSTPKIIRTITSIGELVKAAQEMPEDSLEAQTLQAALGKSLESRRIVSTASKGQSIKSDGFQIDGFSSIEQYYGTDYVEILTFVGDIYDIDAGKLLENYKISIIDRKFVIQSKVNPNWTNHGGYFHSGWRQRPDNLYAMGPLDNLVGMQYRIDHLENLKADVFDLIAHPVIKIKGSVDAFKYEPGAHIYVGEDGDVEFMRPDSTALNAEVQIAELERRMEELAGAPKQAMGIRTPGEKTKFEVQVLDNASSRIFLNKIKHFELTFLEPLLNYMLQLARRNMSADDVTRTLDSEIDAVIFSKVTREDITANGILRPRGASHFAQKANTLQNIAGIFNSAVGQDEAVKVHLSGKKLAKLIEGLADLDDHKLYSENIRIIEQLETQKLMQNAEEQSQVAANTPPGILEGDPASGPIR